MYERIEKKVQKIYDAGHKIFVEIPTQVIKLIKNKSLLHQPSFYPEAPIHKSTLKVFMDQLWEILKYGESEEFYFMYGFDTKTRREMNEYLHSKPFYSTIYRENMSSPFNATCILRNKLYFGFFVKALGIKTGKNVALIVNGSFLDLNSLRWLPISDFTTNRKGVFFCKKIDGECGKGIIHMVLSETDVEINGEKSDIDSFVSMIGKSTYLVQEGVIQHHEMNRMYPHSLNTLRLVTIKNKKTGEIKVFPSNLRIGAHGSFVDNGSQGGIAVGFDLETGNLHEYGLQKPPYGTKTTQHPDTGLVFKDFTIPYIKEAEEQAVFLHSMLNEIYSIGWDIAITEEGPLFIEGNDNWEIQAIQRTHGGLKNTFLAYSGLKR